MDIIVTLLESGCYSAVFAILLAYSIRSSGKREKNYRDVIIELAEGLKQLDVVDGKIDRILEKCNKITEKKRGGKAARREPCECAVQEPLQAEA